MSNNFCDLLNIYSKKKYPNRILTSKFLAEEFNEYADRRNKITTETMRNWKNGKYSPSFAKLIICCNWLGISSMQDQSESSKILFDGEIIRELESIRSKIGYQKFTKLLDAFERLL